MAESTQPKRMDLTEFRNEGYLQEVNRQFFHPLGLALEVVMEEDGTISRLGGIWDYRDDPEGMFFGPDITSSPEWEEKKKKVEAQLDRVTPGRKETLANGMNQFWSGVGSQVIQK